MPNWKKVIVSGSEASLSNLIVDNNVSASIFSGSAFSGSFYGDGSNLSGIIVDDGLPDNNWDFNIPDETPINDFLTQSLVYLIDFNNLPLVGTEAGKIGWFGNTTGETQLIPSNTGLYIVAGDSTVGYITTNGYSGSVVGIGNVMNFSSSINQRINDLGGAGGVVSGSLQIINLGFLQTSSFVAVSGALDTRLDVLESYSASQQVPTSSFSFRTAQTDVYCKNSSGYQIDKGMVVRITGSVGDNPLIVTASWNNELGSANTLGIATETIANDAFGMVITEGVLLGVDTQGMTAGQLIYLGANGAFTTTVPTPPSHSVRLGEVLRVQQNAGSIYVRVDNGAELEELHNVIDTSTDASYGDLLVKSGSLWKNSKQLTGPYAITGSHIVTGSLVVTGSVAGNVVALSVTSGTASIDFNRGTFFTLTIPSSSITHITASNMQPGLTANIVLTQQATTGSVRWDSGFKFPSGSFNTGSASGSAVDIVSMMMVNNSTILSVGANRIQ
jgi:hypothetical protein